MRNYIKSECYRICRSGWVYGMAGILAVLTILYNLVSWLLLTFTPDFPYGTTSFSFSNLVANPMLYCYLAFIIAALLYEADTRNGACKNSIACGISRTDIFFGKCITSFLTAFAMLITTMTAYIASTVLLLEHKGPTRLKDLLLEVPAVSLIALSALILSILLLEIFDKIIVSILVWIVILVAIPRIFLILSLKISVLLPIALWMPENFFSVEMSVNMSQCITLWGYPEGMAKCLISGALGILIFSLMGIWLVRKKDI